jgi:hypothetical protein
MIQSWLAHLHNETRLGPNSVAKAYRVMKGVCDFAVASMHCLNSLFKRSAHPLHASASRPTTG